MKTRHNLMAVTIAVLGTLPLWSHAETANADDAGAMPKHGMHSMHSMPSKQDAAGHHQSGAMPDMQRATPARQPMQGMDHSSMPAAAAGTEVRDPHAYADGYTLESGKYALPGTRQLRLADESNFGMLLADRLERAYGRDANETAYDLQAWFGRDYDRLVVKAEGDVAQGKLQEARTELLWGHAIANYWDAQLGLRADSGVGKNREWLAFGVQGLAPYWFEVDATAYVGSSGRTALRLGAEYELLLTQRLILQPRAEINLYGKSDAARDLGSGLSDGVAGLRLRYEFTRQIAPYVGVEWAGKFGETADLARAAGERTSDTRVVAGARIWF